MSSRADESNPASFGPAGSHVGLAAVMIVGASSSPAENPGGYCPNHATGVKLQDFVVTPLQYIG